MAARHVVVDGSNLATEGRSMPSLAQLDRAVREFLLENPEDVVTVVVDASFGHRIDASEFKVFEEAEAAAELVSPPAGAIGRGDAFLLRIADKTGATVLSNDSFQEFHGDYDWLFERGRLIGGKPVPGVGWIFTPRTPVRGPRSREAVKEAKRKTKGEPESSIPGLDLAAERSRTKGKGKKNVERAIAVALEEVVAPNDKPRRRRKGGSPPADPVNDPLSFITFIAAHPLGGEVTATVESFASHGAFVDSGGARCYVPLSAMGDPPPKSAREIFTKGEQVTFVVQALDPQRRGVELALPGFAKIAGAPTEETVAAEIEARAAQEADDADEAEVGPAAVAPAPARRTRKKAAPALAEVAAAPVAEAPKGAEAPQGDEVPGGAQVSAPARKASPRRRTPTVTAPPAPEAPPGPPGPPGPEVARPVADGAVTKAASRRRGPRMAASPPVATPAVTEAVAEQPAVAVKKAPARRRGPKVEATPPAQADEAPQPETADLPVPPAKASRRRGPRAPTTPPDASAAPGSPESVAPAAQPVAPARKRAQPPTGPATAADPVPDPPPPATRTRTHTRRRVAADAAAEANTEPAVAPTPRPAAKRGAAKKAASPTPSP